MTLRSKYIGLFADSNDKNVIIAHNHKVAAAKLFLCDVSAWCHALTLSVAPSPLNFVQLLCFGPKHLPKSLSGLTERPLLRMGPWRGLRQAAEAGRWLQAACREKEQLSASNEFSQLSRLWQQNWQLASTQKTSGSRGRLAGGQPRWNKDI